MIGLIGGTGLGEALFGENQGEDQVVDTPYGSPSGPIRIVEWKGQQVALLARHGEGHTLNPSQVNYRANIYAMKSLGVTHILASGAVGSLREEIRPQDLVIPDQVIDKTSRRAPTFFDVGLAVHVEFSHPYCGRLRQVLLDAADSVETTVHTKGTYVCMEGPAFSTVAESHLHRMWGGDLIGMTSMPEARLAREAEICYALLALPTDYDCWRPTEPGLSKQKLLEEIIGNLKAVTTSGVTLMRAAIERLVDDPPEACADCPNALELAIWSDRSKLSSDLAHHYGPLLARYVEAP